MEEETTIEELPKVKFEKIVNSVDVDYEGINGSRNEKFDLKVISRKIRIDNNLLFWANIE